MSYTQGSATQLYTGTPRVHQKILSTKKIKRATALANNEEYSDDKWVIPHLKSTRKIPDPFRFQRNSVRGWMYVETKSPKISALQAEQFL